MGSDTNIANNPEFQLKTGKTIGIKQLNWLPSIRYNRLNNQIKYGLIFTGITVLVVLPRGLVFDENLSLCIFKSITDKECPLCGMTRAAYLLLRLQPYFAAFYNPLVFVLPVLLIMEILNDFMDHSLIKRIRHIFWILTLLSLVILFAGRLTTD